MATESNNIRAAATPTVGSSSASSGPNGRSGSLSGAGQPPRSVQAPAGRGVDSSFLELFVNNFFGRVSPKNQPPLLSGGATGTEDNIADVSFLVRASVPAAFGAVGDGVASQAMGVTTGENSFQGLWAAAKAKERFRQAWSAGDTDGIVESGIDTARGVVQSLGGTAYLGYRATMIASEIRRVNVSAHATTSLGMAAFKLGLIGNALFILCYACMAVWSAFNLRRDLQFRSAMKSAGDSEADLLAFLKDRATADAKAQLDALKSLPFLEREAKLVALKAQLQSAALDALTEHFIQMQNQMVQKGQLNGGKPLSADQAKRALRELFELHKEKIQGSIHASCLASLGLKAEDAADLSTLDLIGLMLEQSRLHSKKGAEFARVTNGTCVEAVNKAVASGLAERLQSNDSTVRSVAEAEAKQLAASVKGANNVATAIHAALLFIGILGAVTSIMGFLALSPAAAIALTALTIMLCIAMLIVDGYCLKGSLEGGPVGQHDKKYLLAIGLVMLGAFAGSVALTVAFALPIVPLIGAAIIYGFSVVLITYVYKRTLQKEKQWIDDHPTLDKFNELLRSETTSDRALDDKVSGLFRKLSAEDRKAVREKYFALSEQSGFEFKSKRYQEMNEDGDFGAAYFNQALSNRLNGRVTVAADDQVLVHAVQKTARSCWARWNASKADRDKQAALMMQALSDRVVGKETSVAIDKKVVNDIVGNAEAYQELKSNIWYAAKRQESQADLKTAVQSVVADQANQSISRGKASDPLIERVTHIFASSQGGIAAA